MLSCEHLSLGKTKTKRSDNDFNPLKAVCLDSRTKSNKKKIMINSQKDYHYKIIILCQFLIKFYWCNVVHEVTRVFLSEVVTGGLVEIIKSPKALCVLYNLNILDDRSFM